MDASGAAKKKKKKSNNRKKAKRVVEESDSSSTSSEELDAIIPNTNSGAYTVASITSANKTRQSGDKSNGVAQHVVSAFRDSSIGDISYANVLTHVFL